jgi:hypothetical protein
LAHHQSAWPRQNADSQQAPRIIYHRNKQSKSQVTSVSDVATLGTNYYHYNIRQPIPLKASYIPSLHHLPKQKAKAESRSNQQYRNHVG